MQVELVMPDAETVRTKYRGLIWLAARTCYSKETPQKLWNDFLEGKISNDFQIRVIRHVVSSGHHSVLEHLNFTFAVSGVSRVLTHQLARHRHISLSQQSQRYVDAYDDYVVPPAIQADSYIAPMVDFAQSVSDVLRYQMQQARIPREDVRFFMPQAVATNFLMTANLRALVDICKVRLCVMAQWEIRKLFKTIRKLLGQIDPLYYDLLTIKCIWHGYCDEERNKDGKCRIRPYREPRPIGKSLEDSDTV